MKVLCCVGSCARRARRQTDIILPLNTLVCAPRHTPLTPAQCLGAGVHCRSHIAIIRRLPEVIGVKMRSGRAAFASTSTAPAAPSAAARCWRQSREAAAWSTAPTRAVAHLRDCPFPEPLLAVPHSVAEPALSRALRASVGAGRPLSAAARSSHHRAYAAAAAWSAARSSAARPSKAERCASPPGKPTAARRARSDDWAPAPSPAASEER